MERAHENCCKIFRELDVLYFLCVSSQGLPRRELGAKVLNYPSINVHLPKFLYIISDNLQDLKPIIFKAVYLLFSFVKSDLSHYSSYST